MPPTDMVMPYTLGVGPISASQFLEVIRTLRRPASARQCSSSSGQCQGTSEAQRGEGKGELAGDGGEGGGGGEWQKMQTKLSGIGQNDWNEEKGQVKKRPAGARCNVSSCSNVLLDIRELRPRVREMNVFCRQPLPFLEDMQAISRLLLVSLLGLCRKKRNLIGSRGHEPECRHAQRRYRQKK